MIDYLKEFGLKDSRQTIGMSSLGFYNNVSNNRIETFYGIIIGEFGKASMSSSFERFREFDAQAQADMYVGGLPNSLHMKHPLPKIRNI